MSLISNSTHQVIKDNQGRIIIYEGNKIGLHNIRDGSQVIVDYDTVREVFDLPNYCSAIREADEENLNLSNEEHPSIRLTGNENWKKPWSRDDVLNLIHLYKEKQNLFKSSTLRNEKVWKLISRDMNNQFTAEQCNNKFKYLKSKYMKKKDNMSTAQSGARLINFPFFEEMDEIFRNNRNIPGNVEVASSLEPREVPERVERGAEGDTTSTMAATVLAPSPRGRKRSHMEFLGELAANSERQRERRHQELMQQRQEAMSTFNNLFTQLLEKLN